MLTLVFGGRHEDRVPPRSTGTTSPQPLDRSAALWPFPGPGAASVAGPARAADIARRGFLLGPCPTRLSVPRRAPLRFPDRVPPGVPDVRSRLPGVRDVHHPASQT